MAAVLKDNQDARANLLSKFNLLIKLIEQLLTYKAHR